MDMNSQITGIIGSLYYVGQAAQVNKTDKVDKGFNEAMVERVGKVQKVEKLKALYQHGREESQMKCEPIKVMDEDEGKRQVVMVNHYGRYRVIHLDGSQDEKDLSLINPMKVKAAYFEDEN